MKRNIIWATDSFTSLGEYYRDSGQITAIGLRSLSPESLQPRIFKAQAEQQQRTRKHGEVQTPAWLCCKMNDYLDETWYERKNVFNVQDGHTWAPAEGKIVFPKHRHSSWRQYVDSRRLEITCGEAPFIVSRYDAATGAAIPIERRIGLLDRKLRIVCENTDSEAEWVKWAIRAIQSVYGYEYQGDNLLIARINVLMTFVEYLQSMWYREPTEKELATVANIISWNFWQMDGLTGTVPKGKLQSPEARPITMEELGWFAAIDGATSPERPQEQEITPPCRVCNWRQTHTVTFDSLKTHRGRDVRNMKFDFVIGNPPYQEDTEGTSDKPVYDQFMDAAYKISDKVTLIHPARFLFNAGKTPKAWNARMLSDSHFKILDFNQESGTYFPGTRITGGIAISYRDATMEFGAIEVFSQFEAVRSLSDRMRPYVRETALPDVMHLQNRLNLIELYEDYPALRDVISSNGNERRIVSSAFNKLPIFQNEHNPEEEQICIFGLEGTGQRRTVKWAKSKYIEDNGNLMRYKIMVSKSNGGAGSLCDEPVRIIAEPFMLEPGIGYTQSFIGIGSFESKTEANAALKYLKSKFARCLLGILKITQDNPPDRWRFVPLQDFTFASDIDWTQPIPAIDQQLYRKYGLTDEEIAFIESHVKEMT